MEKLYNLKDTTYIRKLLQNNTVLNDLEQVRRLVRYAGYGKYIGRGIIGINIVTSYSNLATVSDDKFNKTLVGDTAVLLGSSAAATAAGSATVGILELLAGETLLCCGPVGWGILIASAAVGAVAGYYGGEFGEWVGEKIWNKIESAVNELENWLGQVGQAQVQRVKGGYY